MMMADDSTGEMLCTATVKARAIKHSGEKMSGRTKAQQPMKNEALDESDCL